MGAAIGVSTHSRPKAAGLKSGLRIRPRLCFNTQPPEGGWLTSHVVQKFLHGFNTQPPEGGW